MGHAGKLGLVHILLEPRFLRIRSVSLDYTFGVG